MKLSTDALLLGAWAEPYQGETPCRILDIGCGTGVLGLMLAQKYPSALGEAIDLSPEAIATTQRNFSASPWAAQWSCHTLDITAPRLSPPLTPPYDLFISNPPYYEGIPPTSTNRQRARHRTHGFSPLLIFDYLSALAGPVSTLCMVTPIELLPYLRRAAVLQRYYLTRLCYLHATPHHLALRTLTQWYRTSEPPSSCFTEHLYIRTKEQRYTQQTRQLLRPYLPPQYL